MIIVSNRPLKLHQRENISHVVYTHIDTLVPCALSLLRRLSSPHIIYNFIYGTRLNVIMRAGTEKYTYIPYIRETIMYVPKLYMCVCVCLSKPAQIGLNCTL